jgi:hypothetical protein
VLIKGDHFPPFLITQQHTIYSINYHPMNTNPQPVVITNYDAIVEYFNNFPEQLHAPVSNNESRPISPLDYKQFNENRSAK